MVSLKNQTEKFCIFILLNVQNNPQPMFGSRYFLHIHMVMVFPNRHLLCRRNVKLVWGERHSCVKSVTKLF